MSTPIFQAAVPVASFWTTALAIPSTILSSIGNAAPVMLFRSGPCRRNRSAPSSVAEGLFKPRAAIAMSRPL
jgi:hypothetical protein